MLSEIMGALLNVKIGMLVFSKVNGNRNWLIRIEEDEEQGKRIVYAGRYGRGERFLVESLMYMARHKVNWFEYTYKKDYEEAMQILQENGYKKAWYLD